MFVTNLRNFPLGVDGIIILKPNEEARFIEETPDLLARVKSLVSVGLATVSYDEGLEKTGAVGGVAEEAPKTELEVKNPVVENPATNEGEETKEEVAETSKEEVASDAATDGTETTVKKTRGGKSVAK